MHFFQGVQSVMPIELSLSSQNVRAPWFSSTVWARQLSPSFHPRMETSILYCGLRTLSQRRWTHSETHTETGRRTDTFTFPQWNPVRITIMLLKIEVLASQTYLERDITAFAVHYEKIRNHLRETAFNCAKRHSLARKYEHLRINQIQ